MQRVENQSQHVDDVKWNLDTEATYAFLRKKSQRWNTERLLLLQWLCGRFFSNWKNGSLPQFARRLECILKWSVLSEGHFSILYISPVCKYVPPFVLASNREMGETREVCRFFCKTPWCIFGLCNTLFCSNCPIS